MISAEPIRLTTQQAKIARDPARFSITVAGRRGGKTWGSGVKLLVKAAPPDQVVGYVAPTFVMAKRLMWSWLLRHIPRDWIANVNRSDLVITFVNGSAIMLFGSHNYDTMRGLGFDHIEYDEAQDTAREAWTEVGRAALADRRGSAGFRCTPKGLGNWTYDLYTEAAHRADWSRFHYTTLEGGLVLPEEIEAARGELDVRTFRQEYEATFEQYGGLVYDGYSDTQSVRPMAFRSDAETWMCWDFNAGARPMSVILVQRIDGLYYATREFVYTNTNTEEMCSAIETFLVAQQFSGRLAVTGDNAGNRRESSASRSDYTIIEQHFKNYDGYERRTKAVRAIMDRVNALNSLMRPAIGGRRLFIDPSLKALRRGLMRVTWKDNGKGLDETSIGEIDPTDALSYFAYNYHPIQTDITVRHS